MRRELGSEGFFGPATHMYHRHRPTDWVRFEGDLKPRAFDTTRLGASGPGPWDAFGLLHNAHMKLRTWTMSGSMEQLARNADGDELLFIHSGAGTCFATMGTWRYATVTILSFRAAPCGAWSRTARCNADD